MASSVAATTGRAGRELSYIFHDLRADPDRWICFEAASATKPETDERKRIVKHVELFNSLEQNGIAILRTRMPGWEDVWYVLPRPRGLRYVGIVNRWPPLPKPSRLNLNRRPTPLLRTIHEVLWFLEGAMDRSEITDVHPDYAALLGAALVILGGHDSKKHPLGRATWTRSWQRSYQCGVVVPDDLELLPEELANPKLVLVKLKAWHTSGGLLRAA